MCANEKVRERQSRRWESELRQAPLPIVPIGRGTDGGRGGGHVEDGDPPTPYPVGDSRRLGIAHTQLGEAHRIDDCPVPRDGVGNRLLGPVVKSDMSWHQSVPCRIGTRYSRRCSSFM